MKSHRNNKKTRKHKNKKEGGFFNRFKKDHPPIIFKPKDNADLKAKVKDWVNGNKKGLGLISNWDTSDITDMSELFLHMHLFNENISSWDVSKVTNMESMFEFANSFNQPIGEWNVSNVKNMEYMFQEADSFNQPIGEWNVSKVTNMSRMFFNAYEFNQPIGEWNVSNVTDMVGMFAEAHKFNQPIGEWNVSKVTNMEWMFSGASAFNQPIGEWNVSNVTNMSYMFYGASAFNQPLVNWDVSNRPNMGRMFDGARSFNDNNKPRIGPKCMSTDEFNTKCKENVINKEGEVICPITRESINKSTAVQIPGDKVCFDRAALRKWFVELGKRTHPLTRGPRPEDWISRNLVEGDCKNTDQDGGKKRKTRKMKGKRSLRKAKK